MLEHLQDKEILLGVIDLSTPEIESVETIKARVLRAVTHIDEKRIILAPDCGMKYLPRDSAFGKLRNMVQAARELREEFKAA